MTPPRGTLRHAVALLDVDRRRVALALLDVDRRRVALALLLGTLALGCAVALAGTAAWLIARASQMPPVLALSVATVAVRAFGIGRVVQQSDQTAADWVAIALGVLAVHVCLYLAMRFANVIHRVLGDGGTILVTRIAGLLLAAIAVQLIANAVEAFIKAA